MENELEGASGGKISYVRGACVRGARILEIHAVIANRQPCEAISGF